nr:MAG TPA: hypothetical protein [Caudoviricetes sp.]
MIFLTNPEPISLLPWSGKTEVLFPNLMFWWLPRFCVVNSTP